MRRVAALIVFAAAAYVALHRSYSPSPTPAAPARTSSSPSDPTGDYAILERAIQQHSRDVRVDGAGVVVGVLPDDNAGERHQRFIVRLPSGETVLITHNIDVAPRVEGLRVSDRVEFEGEYVWNDKGGLVHWTHHDPAGRHRAGFVLVRGHKYQ